MARRHRRVDLEGRDLTVLEDGDERSLVPALLARTCFFLLANSRCRTRLGVPGGRQSGRRRPSLRSRADQPADLTVLEDGEIHCPS